MNSLFATMLAAAATVTNGYQRLGRNLL